MTSILIFGDAEIIPPCRGMNVRGREPDPILGVSIVGTDVSYSMLRGPDRVPDVAIGRISVDDAAQAEAVVDKIIRYESRDPEDHPEHMAIYSYFQDDTQIYADLEGEVEFTANSRTVQGHETHFLGQFDPATFTDYIRINSEPPTSWARVDRVISDTELELVQRFGGSEDLRGEAQVGYRDGRADWRFLSGAERVRLFMEDRWVTVRFGYTRSRGPTPTHMYDGRMLPHELAAYHWNATTAELRGNWRQGLDGIILHVDHGYRSGWSDPPLDWANIFNPAVPILGEMHNPDDAFYPIVLSINCSSGHFDNETDERRWIDGAVTSDTTTAPLGECFCERMLRHRDGGAVAAVGAARNSGARLNDKFIDGLLGGFYADYAYGSLITSEIREPILRLGPAVSWAKFHLHSCATDPVRRDYNMEIYHLFGDPMLQMNLPAPYREWRTPPIPR